MSVTASLDLLLSLLKPKPTQTEIDEWWSTVDSIAAGIDSFGKKGKNDLDDHRRLREALSDYTGAIANGVVNPDRSSVGRAIMSLRRSVEAGSIGVDGWPIKR
ncbi:hypothetical protein FNL55_13465 [Tardiphaga sp. vice352]|uniref:hypothetical protein n=1 Tax=Tardiphaga sp. vice352 TaxID=2592816 RepID=UPI0011624916|nr:hypothetical protein [Tardiphaga sp. vice352]QDM32237.1 hypothetical protein FNL55_13465 [Tardiphaga sp. vice352]